MEGWVLRPGLREDVHDVLALERATAEAPHWSELDYGAIVSTGEADEGIRRCMFVVEAEGRLLGFAVASVLAVVGRGEIENVAVAASVRRMGVGRALCVATVDWCKEQGAKRVELEVRAGSAGAIALYESLGFLVMGRRRGYYGQPVEDAVVMGLLLEAEATT